MHLFFLILGALAGASAATLYFLSEPDPGAEHLDTDDVLAPRVTDGDLYFTKDTAA
ncbi:hypothetical protein BH787_gp36 [Gordonia phage GMA4]|uniref:hypothetical protein n=1 Tax=Gordonia phage GMA4 TaxID=1647471 RepID=UPI0006BC462B|nr:hypothetical protein BH787_gp36 [Gordonia phage GMA4]AKJ72312.1 hypothetical protein GMA4_37 [Gordonia phage GMA4]